MNGTTATSAIVVYWRRRYAAAPSWTAREISRIRSDPAGCRSSQTVRPMPYRTATAPQTSAKSTAWSLKKSIASCSHKVGADPARGGRSPAHKPAVREATRGRRVQAPVRPPSDPRAFQRRRAHVLRLRADLRNGREEQLAKLFVVPVEDLDHLVVRDGRGPRHADIVVGDHRDVRVAELELPREVALGIRGHVDDVPAGVLEPLRLGAR